jgi:Flp pilus assembly protein CpaB
MSPLRALRRRPGAWFVVAGTLAASAALLTARAGSGEPAGGHVVVAREPIPAGTSLDPERASRLLALAPVPAGLALRGLVRDAGAAVGRRTAAALAAGEPLTDAALGGAPGIGPAPLAPGERAVPVPLVTAGGAAAGLAPGVRVDAVAARGEGPGGRTEVVVAGAEVLAVTDPAPGGAGDGGTVLLRVGRDAALRLTSALNFARDVRLLVRPAGEEAGP